MHSGIGYRKIVEIAANFARQASIASGDIARVFVAMGGRVVLVDEAAWLDQDSASCTIVGKNDITAFLPELDRSLDSLSILCSVGHYYLHSKEGSRSASFKRHGKDMQTLEAIWFALAVLIPDKTFVIAEKNPDATDEVLGSIFNVNPAIVGLKRKILSSVRAQGGP